MSARHSYTIHTQLQQGQPIKQGYHRKDFPTKADWLYLYYSNNMKQYVISILTYWGRYISSEWNINESSHSTLQFNIASGDFLTNGIENGFIYTY